MADDIAFLPASRLIDLYRSKELSPVAVMAETLARLERYEGALNAFVLYDRKARWRPPARPRRAGTGASRTACSTAFRSRSRTRS